MTSLSSIDHRIHAVAQQIYVVQMAAYKHEAELLRLTRFPPLERKIDDILASSEEFVGAFEGGALAGLISIGPDEEGRGINISSLVVHPAYQRRGLGHALVRQAIERYRTSEFTVQTAAANVPALALYAQFGFKEFRRWVVGSEPLELVKLICLPAQTESATYHSVHRSRYGKCSKPSNCLGCTIRFAALRSNDGYLSRDAPVRSGAFDQQKQSRVMKRK